MEVSITKMSQNGQVVIPSEIRKDAGLKPSAKFIIFNKGGNILLKQINKKALDQDMKLMQKIARAEKQIQQGKYTRVSTKMSTKEIVKRLTK
ncbi:AbrB/MazE/SpoVT family DNA-binding domain-containing protein [Nanoarchaeota archaeon]